MGRNLWLHGGDGVSTFAKGDEVSFPEESEGKLTKVEPLVNASKRKLSRKTDPEEFKKFHVLQTGLAMGGVYSSRPPFFKRRHNPITILGNA